MLQAGEVSRQEALEKARRFMPNKEFKQQESFQRKVSAVGPKNSPYYVFNAENNSGFVIVSGDDRTEAILGYSDKGELDIETAPDNVKWLLDYYDKVITAMEKLPENSDEQVSSHRKIMANSSARKTIEPLLKTQWGQGEPYNKYCPEWVGTGLRYPAGCVAVAMAQVINYNKWPKGSTNPVPAYISTKNHISMLALEPTSFNWDNMTEDDIARLMLYCGSSVKMDYNKDGSGASDEDVPSALEKIFGYSKACQLIHRNDLSDEIWEEVIYEELLADRPIIYAGQQNWSNAHAFVIDGYRDGRFHISWGWEGDLDGHFLLTGLTSDSELIPYNNFQTAAVFVKPPICTEEISVPQVNVELLICQDDKVYYNINQSRRNINEDFPVVYYSCKLTTDLPQNTAFHIGLGLWKENCLIEVLSQEKHIVDDNDTFFYNVPYALGKGIQDGAYRIAVICRGDETDEWVMATGSICNYINVLINGSSMSLETIPYYEKDIEYLDYGIHTIDGITYQLSHQSIFYLAEVLPYQQTEYYSGNLVIPDEVFFKGKTFMVRDINRGSLWHCVDLNSLSIGSVMGGNTMIYDCPKLSKIEMREGVSSWGSISVCPSLVEIELPETFESVLSSDFISYCERLNTIRFTGKILTFQAIPNWDALSLPSLTNIYFPMRKPPVARTIIIENENDRYVSFGDIPANTNTTIHIPKGTLRAYQQSQWKNWKFIEDLPVPSSDAIAWDYCHGDELDNNYGTGLGTKNNDAEFAMSVSTKELEVYKGCQITSVEIYCAGVARYDYGECNYDYIFITKRGTDYLVKQPCQLERGKWNRVILEQPYNITGDEIFVGIGRHSSIAIGYSDSTRHQNAYWYRAMGNDYSCLFEPGEWYEMGDGYSFPLPLRFTIEGNNVPQGAVIRELVVAEGDGLNIQAVLRNRSLDIVQSYTVNWVADDGQTGSQTFETYMLPNTSETITIPLPTSLGTGYHAVTFDIPTLDGKENGLKGLNVPTIDLVNGTEGIVVFANNYTREYGEENPMMEFDVRGLAPNGTPEISCDANSASPAGEYPIVVKAGSITNENVAYVNGILTVTKAPLTVTAQDCTMKQGAELPDFMVSYQGFKNGETESVLTKKPIVTTTASSESPVGEYELVASGAEAQNYDFNYVAGWLQVLLRGDLTGSGTVNVQDATLVVNYILGQKSGKYDYTLADMNNDGEVDVFDVTAMIGAILEGANAAKVRKIIGVQPSSTLEQLIMDSSTEGVTLNVDDANRFTSFQMDVEVPAGVELTKVRLIDNETGHMVRYAKIGENLYRVMALSMNSTPLKASSNGLLELDLTDDGDVQINNIMFVTPQGEAVNFDSLTDNVVTSINDIETSEPEEIYDLSGRKMNVCREQLPKGVYIINGKKVVIK